MIIVKAILRNSGRAIIEKDGELFHIEPPYIFDYIKGLSPNELMFAVFNYGFEECNLTFDHYEAVKSYLIKGSNKKVEDKTSKIEEILLKMPPAFLKFHIKKMRELINAKEYKDVMLLANKLKNNKNLGGELLAEVEELNTTANNLFNVIFQSKLTIFKNINSSPIYRADSKCAEMETNSRLVIETT